MSNLNYHKFRQRLDLYRKGSSSFGTERSMRVRSDMLSSSDGFHFPKRKNKPTSISARQSASLTAKKKRANNLPLKKMTPSKSDIRNYCRQNPEYKKLDDFICNAVKNNNHKGVSAATTQRAAIKKQILETLPFGPILD